MKNLKYILFSILLCFIYINNVKAATCVYETSYTAPYKYTITCKSNGSSNAICTIQDNYNQLSIAAGAVSFSIGSTCPNTIYTSSADNEVNNINTTSGDALSLNKSKSTEDNTPTTPSGNETPSTPSTTPDDGKFNADAFCEGRVQGVFTTLGWLFFIVKILIPIILIIFGSIDVAKAVVASKDDEIKKSIKTLAVRAIAGVIIFFVPTLLNFAIKMIDDSDVYNGTFWDCTKCMLDPTNESVCSNLRGDEQ